MNSNSKSKKILITGVNGYIGSILFLYLKKNYDVYGLDHNYSLSQKYFKNYSKKIIKCDLKNKKLIAKVLKKIEPNLIIHLAGLAVVNENLKMKSYIDENVKNTKQLLNIMNSLKIKNFIFSSTASVYKSSLKNLKETSIKNPLSKYAKSKLMAEKVIKKQKDIKSIIFRFFNVCSAFKKPIWGERHDPETHLIPTLIYKSMRGESFFINGDDFNTKDGSSIRDYVHVIDIVDGIEKGIQYLFKLNNKSQILNLGTGKGFSIFEIVKYLKNLKLLNVNFKVKKKRPGDIARSVCNFDKAKKILNWKPKYSKLSYIVNNEIKWVKKMTELNIKRSF